MIRRFARLAALVVLAPACDHVVELHTSQGDAAVALDALGTDAGPDVIPTSCAVPLPCPLPPAGKLTICGAIDDLETDAPIAAPGPGVACSAGAGGACALRLSFYDSLEYAMGPFSAVPREPRALLVDTCGRFRASELPEASFGFMAIELDDPPGAIDAHLPTIVSIRNSDGQRGAQHRAYATRQTTAASWTAAAGLATPLAQSGVLALVFRYHGVPLAGVRPRRASAATIVDALYFADGGTTRHTLDLGATATRTNGTALAMSASPAPDNYDGIGAEPAGCVWPPSLAARIPGAVMVDVRDAARPDGTPCP